MITKPMAHTTALKLAAPLAKRFIGCTISLINYGNRDAIEIQPTRFANPLTVIQAQEWCKLYTR